MPKVLVCVFGSEEIEAQEKWLDVPGRTNEVAHLKCWKENNRLGLGVLSDGVRSQRIARGKSTLDLGGKHAPLHGAIRLHRGCLGDVYEEP